MKKYVYWDPSAINIKKQFFLFEQSFRDHIFLNIKISRKGSLFKIIKIFLKIVYCLVFWKLFLPHLLKDNHFKETNIFLNHFEFFFFFDKSGFDHISLNIEEKYTFELTLQQRLFWSYLLEYQHVKNFWFFFSKIKMLILKNSFYLISS